MLRNPALAFLSNGLSNEPSFRSVMFGIITTPTDIDCEALVFLRVKGNAVYPQRPLTGRARNTSTIMGGGQSFDSPRK